MYVESQSFSFPHFLSISPSFPHFLSISSQPGCKAATIRAALGLSTPKINIFYHSPQQEHFLTFSPRCKTSELLVDHFGKEISSIPTDRTQTQEEALELSVWSQFSTFNMSLLRFSLRTPLLCLHFVLFLVKTSWTRHFAETLSPSVPHSLPG